MKILHVLNELKYSGAEIMYMDAAPVFKELNCDLNVVATGENLGEFAKFFENAGYKVFHKKSSNGLNVFKILGYYKAFYFFIKKEKFDVIHNHKNSMFWGMSLCGKIAGIKMINTFHNVFPTNWYSIVYHICLRWSAKTLFGCTFQTISDSVYDNELKRFKNKTIKIYNWYGSNRFYPAKPGEKEKVRQAFGIEQGAIVLISVGGCSHIKRHSDIIKILPNLIEKYPNLLYLHLGKGDTEHDEMDLARSLGVDAHIRFCENQEDVRTYLIASDIYLMPSKYEGISITTIEALACQIPAVLYDVPGLRDFNKTVESSLLIKPNTVELEKAINTIINKINLKNKIAENGRKFVEETYSMKKNAKAIFQLYIN